MKFIQELSRRSLILALLIVVLFFLVYVHTLADLVSLWSGSDDYGHGFFIIPLTLYLIWRKRRELSEQSMKPAPWGFALLALWAILYGVGTIGHISTFTHLSMLVYPLAATGALINAQTARIILYPVAFMVFMFPIPSEIYTRVTNPLLLLSTSISFYILSMFHVPVLREGNLLTLPNYTMEVVQACSGIRSLMSIMALAFLMGYIMLANNLLRIGFFLLSVPTAILGNILRISATAFLAYYISPQAAEGASHTLAGILTFAFSFVLLFGFMEFILWILGKKESSSLS